MKEGSESVTQEQLTQPTVKTNNDSQASLFQLLAPFIDAAPPGKLNEVIFYLKSLLARLLVAQNCRASPHNQIPDYELHDFLQTCLPALCLRRILQKDGCIVSLATTKSPQIQEQFSKSCIFPRNGKKTCGLVPHKVHMALSHTNHLLSWVMKVKRAKNVDASGLASDQKYLSHGSAPCSFPQGSTSGANRFDSHASHSVLESIHSWDIDTKGEHIFPCLSHFAKTSYSATESNDWPTTVTEVDRRARKNRFSSGLERDPNTVIALSNLKKFFSHVPSIFVAKDNEDTGVSVANEKPGSSQERSPDLEEEEEDLFHDLCTVSYGFDQLENVFFDLQLGLYVEVDVVMNRCIRVIFFSTVDEIIPSAPDSVVSLFRLFHKELKQQRQSEDKSSAKEAVGATEHWKSAEEVHSEVSDLNNEPEVKISLFDPFFLEVRKKLEAELQTQLIFTGEANAAGCVGIKELDKKEAARNLTRECYEKRSAVAGVAKLQGDDAGTSKPQPAWQPNDRAVTGTTSAFTAVVWPHDISSDHGPDLLPPGALDQSLTLESTLLMTACKSQEAPVRGWGSLWTSRYALSHGTQLHAGGDSLLQQNGLSTGSCGAAFASVCSHLSDPTVSSLTTVDSDAAPLSSPRGGSGEGSRGVRERSPADDTATNCCLLGLREPSRPAAVREPCLLTFSATSEVWLFYNAAACAGTGPCEEIASVFSTPPGGMHQRWVTRSASKKWSVEGAEVAEIVKGMVAQIREHERMVRDSIVRACVGMLQPKRSMGMRYLREGTKPPLPSVLPRRTPSTFKTHFDPLRYDESILSVPFHPPPQEES